MTWIAASLIVVVMWGVVGLLQKIGANRCSPDSLFLWTSAGYILLLPWVTHTGQLAALTPKAIVVGLVSGLTNGLGAWFLYSALEKGAPASVAVPLTALNPLLTVILAVALLGERLTGLQIAGVVLALGAAVLLSYESEPLKEKLP